MLLHSKFQLGYGILRPMKSMRKNPTRQRAFRKCGIINDRQNRMEEWGSSQLSLLARFCLSVFFQEDLHDLMVDLQQARFLRLGEVAALFPQHWQFGEEFGGRVTAPGQIEPDLQIEKFLVAEVAQTTLHI